MRDLKPAASNYAVKPALYGFDFAHVTKLNARWMRTCSQDATLQIRDIRMVTEQPATLTNIVMRIGGQSYPVTDNLSTGETLDVFPDGTLLRCKGAECQTKQIPWPSGRAVSGKPVQITTTGTGTADISVGLLGAPLLIP